MINKDIIDKIVAISCDKAGVSVEKAMTRSRRRNVVIARQCAIWIMRTHLKHMTLMQIAEVFGGLHHSTVIHAMNAVDDQIFCNNPHFKWVTNIKNLDEALSEMLKELVTINHSKLDMISFGNYAYENWRDGQTIEECYEEWLAQWHGS